MFQFQTQATRDASGADIRGGLRQGPLRVNRVGCARTSRFRSAPQIGPRVSRSGLRLRVISRLMHRSKWRLRGRDASYLAFPAQICERLGVKFPGSTRHPETIEALVATAALHSMAEEALGASCKRRAVRTFAGSK
jgi:hypothetical protein